MDGTNIKILWPKYQTLPRFSGSGKERPMNEMVPRFFGPFSEEFRTAYSIQDIKTFDKFTELLGTLSSMIYK